MPAGSSAPIHHATRPARCRRCASSHASSVLPAPGMPYSTTGRWPPSSSAASTTPASSGRSTNARARCGRFDRSAGPAALTVPSACWASTAAWTRRSGGAGSTPSCSAKRPTAALVGGERVGLAACRVERHHLPGGQRLPQRVARHQLAEPVDVLAAPVEPHVRVGERLGRRHPQLVEPVGLGVDDRDVGDVGDPRSTRAPPASGPARLRAGRRRRRRRRGRARGARRRPRRRTRRRPRRPDPGRRRSRRGAAGWRRGRAPCAAATRTGARRPGLARPLHTSSTSRSAETGTRPRRGCGPAPPAGSAHRAAPTHPRRQPPVCRAHAA